MPLINKDFLIYYSSPGKIINYCKFCSDNNIDFKKNNSVVVNEEKNLFSKDINIVGIYDPSDNDLTMNMWINSNGKKVL